MTTREPDDMADGGARVPTDRVFEVRVAGLVPQTLVNQLGDVEVSSQELRTLLTGRFQDQAELHGFLARLRALGLDIVEIRRVTDASDPGTTTVDE